MELNKYNHIINTFKQYEEQGSPYWYTVEWESVDEPTILKNFSGAQRATGVDGFVRLINSLNELPNCAKIHVTVYSGRTGKKLLLSEVMVVRTYIAPYPMQPPPQPQPAPKQLQQQPQPQPQQQMAGLDLLGVLFGTPSGGLGATDVIQGALAIRDERLTAQFERKDLERDIAQLKLDKELLQSRLNEAEKRNTTLDTENGTLADKLDEYEQTINDLKKYVPENSVLGVSLSALGSSILSGFVKKVVSRNPQGVANLLGTDVASLGSLFGVDAPEADEHTPTATGVAASVEMDDQTTDPARQQELQLIGIIANWLKTLDRGNLARVRSVVAMWQSDIATLPLMLSWAQGGQQGTTDAETETEQDNERDS